jgi:G3E family GTPase
MRRGWLLASGITLTMFVPMSPALAWVGGEPPDTAPVETTGLAVPMPIAERVRRRRPTKPS